MEQEISFETFELEVTLEGNTATFGFIYDKK